MKATIEEEEDLAAAHDEAHGPDRELTLSSTTLLGIFFGLVLLCGLFFGLGYTLGRRSSTPSGETATAQSTAPPLSSTLASGSKPKPSATTQLPVEQTQTQSAADVPATDTTQAFPPDSSAPRQESAAPTAPARTQDVALPVPNGKSSAPVPAVASLEPAGPVTAAAGIMVQIAAISNSADADVLVSALRKHGYSVIVRHEPADTLLHVQVGPFATKAEAVAIRQRLLSDGYNAILK